MTAVAFRLDPFIELTDEVFLKLCQANPDIKFESTAQGELIVVPPTGGETGNRNLRLTQQLGIWSDADGTGLAFDSSTLFILPNKARRSPDAAWILLERWNQLTPEERETFPPICPDFVVELRSPSDSLRAVQDKMQEYMDNDARLGWLINPKAQQVEIYRQGQEKELLQAPASLSGEQVLPGFVLDLKAIL
ncbi:MAG: Uma2 family endonuclease [Chroococcidiopsidaceae cyanobacterium CP_BM_RX_35]|nr:Uma2 family endonuclease [Chroococcidiopsidaceae cyanobacterium CP_BM_RX_35]